MNTLSHINNVLLSVPVKDAGRYIRFELYDETNTLIYVGRAWFDAEELAKSVNITDIIRSYKPIVNDSQISQSNVVAKQMRKYFYVKMYEVDGTFIGQTSRTGILMAYPIPTSMGVGKNLFEQFNGAYTSKAGLVPCWQFNKFNGTIWSSLLFDVYPRYPMGSKLLQPKFTLLSNDAKNILFYQYDKATDDYLTTLASTITAGAYSYALPTTAVSDNKKTVGVWTSQFGNTTKYYYNVKAAVIFHIEDFDFDPTAVSEIMMQYDEKYTPSYCFAISYQSEVHHGIGQQFILKAPTVAEVNEMIDDIEEQINDAGMSVLQVDKDIITSADHYVLPDAYAAANLYGWHISDQEIDTIKGWIKKAMGVEDDDLAYNMAVEWKENDLFDTTYMEIWEDAYWRWIDWAQRQDGYRAIEDNIDGDLETYDRTVEPDRFAYSVPNIMKLADLDECPSRYYLQWEDRFGSAFCWPFAGKETRSLNYSRTNIENQYGQLRPVILQNETTFELNTSWINDKEVEVLESIMVSPWLALYDTERDLKFNVVVDDKSYVIKTRENQGKKMYNITIKCRINNKENLIY